MTKTLVISGGGAKGAFAGGVIEYLINSGVDWDLYAGTSTGSLILPLVACMEIDKLKNAYTKIKPEDIFTVNPFKKINNEIRINHISILYNLIFNRNITLGDSSQLRNTINRFLSKSNFNSILNSDKNIIITVSNLSTEELEIKSIRNETYNDFCDWLQASASATPFMSIVNKNGYNYADGGIFRYVPIFEAIKNGATDIDCIILNDNKKNKPSNVNNTFELMSKIIRIFLNSRRDEDIDLFKISSIVDKEITLRIYNPPYNLTDNCYVFDNSMMSLWWDEGYNQAKSMNYTTYKINKNYIKKESVK